MSDMASADHLEARPASSPLARIKALGAFLKKNRAQFFWAWIAYQSVKGVLTLSLIWIPLIAFWLNR